MRANVCKARTDKTGKRPLAGILFFVSAKQPFRSVSVQRFNREQQEASREASDVLLWFELPVKSLRDQLWSAGPAFTSMYASRTYVASCHATSWPPSERPVKDVGVSSRLSVLVAAVHSSRLNSAACFSIASFDQYLLRTSRSLPITHFQSTESSTLEHQSVFFLCPCSFPNAFSFLL